MIANCEFFYSLQSTDSQSDLECILWGQPSQLQPKMIIKPFYSIISSPIQLYICIDFSSAPKLRQLCGDSNPGISQIPVSLAPLSWWGILGVAGCSVLLEKGDIGVTKLIHECQVIPPLLELAARSLHCHLKGEFSQSIVSFCM